MAHPVKTRNPKTSLPTAFPMTWSSRDGTPTFSKQTAEHSTGLNEDRFDSRVIDFSATHGHIVTTSLDRQRNNFYVGNLGTFPITPGMENIYRIGPNGKLKIVTSGLTTLLGVAFYDDQRMYVLETSTTGPTLANTLAPSRTLAPDKSFASRVRATGRRSFPT